MDKREIREYILGLLKKKLMMFEISEGELNDDFDIVRSGLLDSMAFIDLVADMEKQFDIEIDFEVATENDDFTQLGGLIALIMKVKNAG